ncbi:vanadium-dependent haloperoxidase [Alteromonas facilis]|uniref:vanadium-dependent haloperoxidase n=1 Tax=Alteromonas facilis TaxID=2048004 RepID=UPI001F0CAEEB|nr:vanadium-dependent haloperoxidase [Alteromonas facilis]
MRLLPSYRFGFTVCFAVLILGCGGEQTSESPAPAPQQPPVESITPERAGHSVARMWNEALLFAIRNDFARPTVHARNLFHISASMYDAWASYDANVQQYLFGANVSGFTCTSDTVLVPNDRLPEQEKAISFAAYRLIKHRFKYSPGVGFIYAHIDALMQELGYDASDESLDYSAGNAAALGNAIADCYISFGLQDGANEAGFYENQYYQPINPPLVLDSSTQGNPTIQDLNRWQPLVIQGFIDQAGNRTEDAPEFLSPEWGQVVPFSLSINDRNTFERDGYDYQVYHDPGNPPLLGSDRSEEYQWGFALVGIWSSHLSTQDDVMWDISPNRIGNIQSFPQSFEEYLSFYKQMEGGDASIGYAENPVTGEPYEEQWVPRGDYTRVLAEFWADGPDSETPPGHWFVIMNEISDHPMLEKRWGGSGSVLGNLEWDIKTYFSLGGTMHDVAISAWGIKGRYDYIRPVSAIRAMADKGQSTDPDGPSYHPLGLPLLTGFIEVVEANDPLAGAGQEHVGKLKLYAWKGPDYINDPNEDTAGVGWVLAENWWPYQRPTFVTPPFAGYVSGHSTYSRAAAELLTLMTGSPYFPGGMSDFVAPANDFLVFEKGPSVPVVLQWATYRDAADQCSLSRIWGGIHPPADDIPGREIGEAIGREAFAFAQQYFSND